MDLSRILSLPCLFSCASGGKLQDAIDNHRTKKTPLSLFQRLRMARDIVRGCVSTQETSCRLVGSSLPQQNDFCARVISRTSWYSFSLSLSFFNLSHLSRVCNSSLLFSLLISEGERRPKAGQSDARRIRSREDRRLWLRSPEAQAAHTRPHPWLLPLDGAHNDSDNDSDIHIFADGGFAVFFSFVKAPEVMLQKPYNHAADVYSWAIILWQLITGACSASPYRKEEVPVERSDQRLSDPLLFMARLQCVRSLFEIQVLDLLPWGRNIVFIACRSSGTL